MNARQITLATVFCSRTKPPPNSADADCIAYCANSGFPFLCKSTDDDPKLPSREWICTHLASDCGLPVANCAAVEIDGRPDILFGSQWEGGTKDYYQALPLVQNSNVFSGTLAFDFTSNNGDRHLNNYLYLEVQGQILIKLIDFSRALNFNGWPMPQLPIPPGENTNLDFYKWSLAHPFIKAEAEKIINKWNALPNDRMSQILGPMPLAWMSDADRQILIDWWSSDARIQRGNEAKRSLP